MQIEELLATTRSAGKSLDLGYGTCVTTLHLRHEQQVRELLGIPESFTQGCLLPVGRLRSGLRFTATPRRAIDEVVGIDGWEGR